MSDTDKQLLSIVERVERLHEERQELSKDISDVYAEAKGNGFDVKAIKALISERRKDPSELQEADAILDTYREAIRRAQSSSGTRVATRAPAQERSSSELAAA